MMEYWNGGDRKMTNHLSPEDLKALLDWPTPAISNAIELFEIRPRNQGFMLPEIQCRFPDLKPMIGYAVTGIIRADSSEGHRVSPSDWWAEIQKYPEPRVVVLHDIDNPIVGSYWGEVNGNIHKTLGCVYVHMIDFGTTVKVGGLKVKPGDLIMGDKHGVISIPLDIARDVPKAAQMIEDWERNIINFCKSDRFSVEGLKERYLSPRPSWPPK
jgi:hypothetical protein